MELRHLRYFVAVAEELNFTRAAERLHIAQPPLSQQIFALESELGVALFERTKRRVALTDAGKRFLERSRRILEDTSNAAEEARRAGLGEVGELRIGYTSSLPLTPLLSSVLRDYRRRHPDVRLVLREMFTPDQFDALRHDRLDIGFVRHNPDGNALPGLRLHELQRDPLRMVLPASHPLADANVVSIAQFRDDHFIMYPRASGAGLATVIHQLCASAGFAPKIMQEAEEATTQIGLVAAGLGVSVMPAPLECVKVADVRYVPLSDAGAFYTMFMALAERESSPVQTGFVEAVRVAAEYGK